MVVFVVSEVNVVVVARVKGQDCMHCNFIAVCSSMKPTTTASVTLHPFAVVSCGYQFLSQQVAALSQAAESISAAVLVPLARDIVDRVPGVSVLTSNPSTSGSAPSNAQPVSSSSPSSSSSSFVAIAPSLSIVVADIFAAAGAAFLEKNLCVRDSVRESTRTSQRSF